jgi:hypothetical protein
VVLFVQTLIIKKLAEEKEVQLSQQYTLSGNKQNMGVFFLNVCITFVILSKQAYAWQKQSKEHFLTNFLLPLDRICMHFAMLELHFDSWYIHAFAIFYIWV